MNNIDGFTGIDKTKTRTDIMNFDNEAAHALYRCHQALDDFLRHYLLNGLLQLRKHLQKTKKKRRKMFLTLIGIRQSILFLEHMMRQIFFLVSMERKN